MNIAKKDEKCFSYDCCTIFLAIVTWIACKVITALYIITEDLILKLLCGIRAV